ncbi:MAG: helix-turn-helix domain-containing protein [Treponema sp.]|nr:helix-turn-helix domain-containing protein [Treponema sp.]
MKKNAGGDWGFLHYLPYSKEDEKLGMVCTTAGSVEVPPGTEYPPRKTEHPFHFRSVDTGRILPEYQLVYITRGEGTFSAGEKTWEAKSGSAFLVLPGLRHRYGPSQSVGWHENWVGFKGSYFNKLAKEGFLTEEHVFFTPGLSEFANSLFDRIFDEVRRQKPLYQMKACSAVLALLWEILSRSRRQDQPDIYEKIVEQAKYLMTSNTYGAINIPSIAAQIGISTSRLNEIFKQFTSMTPYQYYIHIKIHKAEDLLVQEEISVKEAAWRMGFDDQYYFSRLFKNKTGIAPSDWKKYSGQ